MRWTMLIVMGYWSPVASTVRTEIEDIFLCVKTNFSSRINAWKEYKLNDCEDNKNKMFSICISQCRPLGSSSR